MEDITSALQVLDLSNNFLAAEGCRELMEHMPHLRQLSTLSLRNNDIGDVGVFYIQAALTSQMCENCSLNALDISENNISYEGTKFLCDVIDDSTTLQHLDITGNFIGHEGGKMLTECFADNKVLVTLYYGSTGVSPEQSKALQNAIERNRQHAGMPIIGGASRRGRTRPRFGTSIHGLDYDDAAIKPLDFEHLCNTRAVNLSCMQLTGLQAAKDLAAGLLQNQGITLLDLSGNKLRCDCIQGTLGAHMRFQ